VVAARLGGNWLMLDNRHMAMVEDKRVRRYRPVFLVDRDGVKLYSDTPSIAEGWRGAEPNPALGNKLISSSTLKLGRRERRCAF
jgi:hypothetical protein